LIPDKPDLPEAELPEQKEEEIDSRELDGWKIGRSLLRSAKSISSKFQTKFYDNWKFLLGENHWKAPANTAARKATEWQNRGVRNWTFAAVDQKASSILSAEPRITAYAWGANSSFIDQYRAAQAVEHELDRMRRREYEEDAFWDGAACSIGVTRVVICRDERSGMKFLKLESVDPTRFHVDPEADRLHECRYINYEPDMDMADIRKYFPLTWHRLLKEPDRQSLDVTTGSLSLDADVRQYRSKSDWEMVSSGGREITGGKGPMISGVHRVCYTLIKDDEVIEEVERRVLQGEQEGYQCAQCSSIFYPPDPMTDVEEMAMPESVMCPDCGSEAVAGVTIPPVEEQGDTVRRYKYPYGRLIVHTETALLYDGPNQDEIEELFFPFAVYSYYRIPHRFLGYGDVDLLRSAQSSADRTMAQLLDYLRLCVNGVFEYPDEAYQYDATGNAPGQKVALPPNLIGMARTVPPAPINLGAVQLAEDIAKRDFGEMSGITPISTGTAPSAPSSGREVEMRQRAAATRLGGHLFRFNQYRTDIANIVWQLMWQHYREPRMVPMKDSQGQKEMVELEVRSLPRNLKMVVTADPDTIERNDLTGQNLQGLITQGVLPMWPDMLLPAIGIPAGIAAQIQERMRLAQVEQQMATEQQIAGQEGMPPEGMPPEGIPPEEAMMEGPPMEGMPEEEMPVVS